MSEIYLEFATSGKVTKVTAIDADSGIEAVVVCPSGLPRKHMEMVAIKKLEYIKSRGNNFVNNTNTSDTIA